MSCNIWRWWRNRAQAGRQVRRRPVLEALEHRLAPAATLSLADASVVEPVVNTPANMTFTLTRTGDLSAAITVDFTTVAGTALPNAQFTPVTGTATLAPGSATVNIDVPVISNGVFDPPSKTFDLQVTGINNIVPASATPAVGGSPTAVAVGDINGDNRPDAVIANLSDGTVSVLLNTTAPQAIVPSFAVQQPFSVGNSPSSVAVGDINGDGRPDLVVANLGDGNISVLLNTTTAGSATAAFAPQQAFNISTSPVAVTLANLNNDTRPDVIVANQAEGTVSVLLNTTTQGNATATFDAQVDVAAGNEPIALAAADFNGDQLLDIAAVNQSDNAVSVLLNTTAAAGPATFAAAVAFATGATPNAVAAGDVNGDNSADLVVANPSDDTVSVLLNQTAAQAAVPVFAEQVTFATGVLPNSVALGNVDGDNRLDIVVANGTDNTVSLLLNTTVGGALSFAPRQNHATGQFPRGAALIDLNSDASLDIVSANFTDGTASAQLNAVAVIADNQGTGTITETQPTVQFGVAASSVPENAGPFSFTVTLSKPSAVATIVPFTVGGSATSLDFAGLTASPLTIPAGQTSGVIAGTLTDDALTEGNETLLFTLGTPTNATLGILTASTLTVTDNEAAAAAAQVATTTSLVISPNPAVPGQRITYTISVRPATGSTPVSGRVTLNGLPGGPVTVNVVNGRATFRTALALGRRTVSASFAGSDDFLPSRSTFIRQTVETIALQPGSRRGRVIVAVGVPLTGRTRIEVTRVGRAYVVRVTQLSGGRLRATRVVSTLAAQRLLVIGRRAAVQVVIGRGVVLPVSFITPSAIRR
jgi:hypothetical protein